MSAPIVFGSQEELNAAIATAVRAATPAPAPAAAPVAPVMPMVLPAAAHPAVGGWPANVAAGPWAPPAPPMMPASAIPGAAPTPQGIAFKLTVPLPDGSEAPVDLHFGPEYASPQALVALVGQLIAAGYPIKVYRPRQNAWGGRSDNFGRGGFDRGGYGGNNYGGGFRRGGWR